MISSEKYGVLLVGGLKCKNSRCITTYGNKPYLSTLLSLKNIAHGWKEINLPNLDKLRENHLALLINENEKNMFLGKLLILYF